jgi:hypothetical protein
MEDGLSLLAKKHKFSLIIASSNDTLLPVHIDAPPLKKEGSPNIGKQIIKSSIVGPADGISVIDILSRNTATPFGYDEFTSYLKKTVTNTNESTARRIYTSWMQLGPTAGMRRRYIRYRSFIRSWRAILQR